RVLATVGGTITWSEDGAEGNGTTGYIDTNYNPVINGVNYTRNNAGVMFARDKVTDADGGAIFGNKSGTQWVDKFSTNSFMNINSSSSSTPARTRFLGLNSVNRTSSTSVTILDGSTLVSAVNSSTIENRNFYILARNISGI